MHRQVNRRNNMEFKKKTQQNGQLDRWLDSALTNMHNGPICGLCFELLKLATLTQSPPELIVL